MGLMRNREAIERPLALVIAADPIEGERLCARLQQLGFSATWGDVEASRTEELELLLSNARIVLVDGRAASDRVRSWIERVRSQMTPVPILLHGLSERECAWHYLEADDVLPIEDEAEWACRVRVWAMASARWERLLEAKVAERTDLLERALSGQGLLLDEVRAARARWEATFNAITDGLMLTTPRGIIEQTNEAFARLFGVEREQWLGRSCSNVWERLGRRGPCPHERVLATGAPCEEEVHEAETGRTFRVRIMPVKSARGEIQGLVHSFRDVTVERHLQWQARHAERMVLAGQIVSGIAHEAATPLSVIANLAEALLWDVPPDSSMASDLRSIAAQARRIAEMLRRLLDFVRQAPPAFRALDVNALVEETLALLRHSFRAARIEVITHLDPDLPPLWADEGQIQQVLLNLFTNAIHAMPEGGRLIVRTELLAGTPTPIHLTVEDTGTGIPPEYLPRIFDFFFTTRADRGGTGLGLAIARQIVEAYEGTIEVESTPGKGTRFRLRFPLRAESARVSAGESG
ncbi:MAG: ATP-binding protein [Blastocatellia bacterium]|nr:ATP-binding protein [Blastocatellia bacterium]MCS7156226.1 ATP-binding protein [Blastocatellia bacterium]MCX7751424.1 ATP-binding protein [Blastocatellia bacterium]MDW8169137.1 ATP-binding protein [Acidobacteriota bacterium]MDW8255998.1 ATP-binding protein [Acidobacteriota bacterium]